MRKQKFQALSQDYHSDTGVGNKLPLAWKGQLLGLPWGSMPRDQAEKVCFQCLYVSCVLQDSFNHLLASINFSTSLKHLPRPLTATCGYANLIKVKLNYKFTSSVTYWPYFKALVATYDECFYIEPHRFIEHFIVKVYSTGNKNSDEL